MSRTPKSFPATPDPYNCESRGSHHNRDFLTVELNQDINQMLQKLGDRIEARKDDDEERLPSIDEIGDYNANEGTVPVEIDDEQEIIVDEEFLEELDRDERLQYFRERRYSVFPIP